MNARQRGLALALLATLAAAFWPNLEEQPGQADSLDVVEAITPRHVGRLPTPEAAVEIRHTAVNAPRFAGEAAGDLFPHQSWQPPRPPPRKVASLPPPPPTPPRLPFTFLGKWTEQGKATLFLSEGDHVFEVHPGDVIAGSWRLDQQTAEQLVFTYLPMDMTQTMRITP